MNRQTLPALPTDYGNGQAQHQAAAEQMRSTDHWVHVGDYTTRGAARRTASQIRTSTRAAYRGHLYDARTITTREGEHQVWGRWIGPREARR